jgi:putative ABC transport system permease protein
VVTPGDNLRGLPRLETLARDIRYALRTFRKQPAFTLIVGLTLTLGIGANTAIFSVLYQLLLRPLPYVAADRLLFIWNTYPGINLPQATVSIPDYLDRRSQAPAIEDATLFTNRNMNLTVDGQPEQLRALMVTPSFFSTLGRYPLLGRPFTERNAMPNADKFVILTNGIWMSRFGGDRSIVGQAIRLNAERYEVLGVLPADFEMPSRDVALLVPFSFTPQQMSDQERGNEFSRMIARIRPGATIAQVNGQMKMIVDRNVDRLPQFQSFARTSGFGGYGVPLRDQLVGNVRAALYMLQVGVLVLLLVACASVANLLLMRATARHRELSIRSALGAGRQRIVAQLLTESIMLSLIGGAGGLIAGLVGVRALVAVSARQLPGVVDPSLNPAVLAFTMALSVVTGVVFGLAPALAVARADTFGALKDSSLRSSAGRGTGVTRTVLVIAEMALALVLLVSAGLLIKSFVRLQSVNPGFSTENTLTTQLALPATRYADDSARRQFWERLIEKARAIPGVMAVGLTSNLPFSGDVSSGSYAIVGHTLSAGEAPPHGRQEVVGGDYFRALQIPLIEGRPFNDGDTAGSPPVVVVDELLARRYFSGRSAIGQQIQRGGPTSPKFTIVGVVGTINSIDLGEPVTKERLLYPVTQSPGRSMTLLLKSRLDPTSFVPQVRAAVRALDPEQPVAEIRTMDQTIARSLDVRRIPMALLGIFGAVALVLSAIGIYGVLAFSVAQRAREFGIRQALGANTQSILWLVLWHGLRTAGIGIAVGVAAALGVTRFLQSQLFEIGARDPWVLFDVSLLLLGVSALACYLPARRATRVDPIVALRCE